MVSPKFSGRWQRQRRLLLICRTPLRWPEIMEIDLLIRGSFVIGENHRHPALVGQAKQSLIPARIGVTPPFALAAKLGGPGQEFIGERSGVVFFSVMPAKIMVLLTGGVARVQAGRLHFAEARIAKKGRDCDRRACLDRSSSARRYRLAT